MTNIEYIKSNHDLLKIGLVAFIGTLLITISQFSIDTHVIDTIDYTSINLGLSLLLGFGVLAYWYYKVTNPLKEKEDR
jgi:hypothetical protein